MCTDLPLVTYPALSSVTCMVVTGGLTRLQRDVIKTFLNLTCLQLGNCYHLKMTVSHGLNSGCI